MYTRLQRRKNTFKKQKKREKMLKIFGEREGLLYRKQREKIEKSTGFMRDGNVSHFVNVGFKKKKTKNTARHGTIRNLSYGKRHQYRARDQRKLIDSE